MKQIATQLLSALVLLLTTTLTACNSNNGDIGKWYGLWKIESITVDGKAKADYDANLYWAFQNNIIEMTLVIDESLQVDYSWGTWSDANQRLTIDFTHHEDANNSNSPKYTLPELTGLPNSKVVLEITKFTNKSIHLLYINDQGETYRYYLVKWG